MSKITIKSGINDYNFVRVVTEFAEDLRFEILDGERPVSPDPDYKEYTFFCKSTINKVCTRSYIRTPSMLFDLLRQIEIIVNDDEPKPFLIVSENSQSGKRIYGFLSAILDLDDHTRKCLRI